jgi:hypothetical protein
LSDRQEPQPQLDLARIWRGLVLMRPSTWRLQAAPLRSCVGCNPLLPLAGPPRRCPMTLAGAHEGTSGDLSPGLGMSGDPGRHRWLRWLLLALGVLMVATLVILAVLAGSYQPLTYGESENSAMAFPGLPTGQGIHPVNNMGGFSEDFYLPPQRGTFSLFASLGNYGTYPITIESVSLPATRWSSLLPQCVIRCREWAARIRFRRRRRGSCMTSCCARARRCT